MRKLVTIRTIDSLTPIEGADIIERAEIDGWQLVVKKGEFKVGDKCLYFEIDSFIPVADTRLAFLKDVKKQEERQGYRIKTIRLKGQVSQGLALPLALFPEVDGTKEDYAEVLGITKWEYQLSKKGWYSFGNMKVAGNFPYFIPKTDQENFQNVKDDILQAVEKGETFEVSMKLDGSSFTIYNDGEKVGVCSRNFELKPDADNSWNKAATKLNLLGNTIPVNYALQGELVGPGMNGNRENFKELDIYFFAVYLIKEAVYAEPSVAAAIIENMGLKTVPILHERYKIKGKEWPEIRAELLEMSKGKSINHEFREGVVFKSNSSSLTFKVVSEQYRLNEK